MSTENQIWYGKMVKAILLDDATAVAELAFQQTDVNMLDDTGRTVLHIAVMHRSGKALPPLLAAGADASIINEYGMTPLGLAMQSGADTLAQILSSAAAEKAEEAHESPAPGGRQLAMKVKMNSQLRYLNLRAAPENNARVVATAVPSTIMTVVGISGEWVEVELDRGMCGWAHRSWLNLNHEPHVERQ